MVLVPERKTWLMIRKELGLTLVELIIAIVLCGVTLAAAMAGYNFIFAQTRANIERGNVGLQIAYALENIHLHTLSAVRVENASLFTESPLKLSENRTYCFEGEADIYNITPNKLGDNLGYCYYIDGQGNFIRNATNPVSLEVINETLVDSKYNPQILFSYVFPNEPNVLTVLINATGIAGRLDTQVSRQESMSFWFTNVKE